MNKYLVALLMIGSLLVVWWNNKQTLDEIYAEVNATGTITNAQAEIAQAEGLSMKGWGHGGWLEFHGLKFITDEQAEILSKVRVLELNGLTSITDAQAESLSKVEWLELDSLTSISDAQAESLSKVETLYLGGLKSMGM